MKKRISFSFITFLLAVSTNAQSDSTSTYFIRATVHSGLLLPEYGFISYLSDNYLHGCEVNICKQTHGKNIWERMYRYPAFGVGFYFSTNGSAQYFGNQFSIYPYYQLNLVRKKRFEFNYSMGVGAAYDTKDYNAQSNYENMAIGSHLNFHFHADFFGKYKVSRNLFLHAGIAFTHISNANLSEPNVGLNCVTANAGIVYGFGHYLPNATPEIEKFNPFFTYEVLACGGVKHTRTFESFQYHAYSLSFDAKRRTRYKFAFGVGADFFYDSSIEAQMHRLGKDFKSSNSYTSGVHFSEEFIYNKVSLILQEGFYLGLTDKLNNYPIYNRAIARYKFSSHFFASFSMKSYLYILDFPELGAGFYW